MPGRSSTCQFPSRKQGGHGSTRSDDESLEGTNTWDPSIDFEQETNHTEDEKDEDVGLSPELERTQS